MGKITKVYTRHGDKGETSLVGGVRIKKCDVRLEAYGTVDELSAQLGLLVALMAETDAERPMVLQVQNTLFNVCTHLATDQSQTPLYASARLPEGAVAELEQHIDRLMSELPGAQGFILSGGTLAAAQAHVCRTVCRRAERRIVALAEVAEVGEEVQRYVNRLSDYLFALAKKINFNAGHIEILWQNACN
jgi:cob(I)alamin adenosyltransferase